MPFIGFIWCAINSFYESLEVQIARGRAFLLLSVNLLTESHVVLYENKLSLVEFVNVEENEPWNKLRS